MTLALPPTPKNTARQIMSGSPGVHSYCKYSQEQESIGTTVSEESNRRVWMETIVSEERNRKV
jgi:hypothetical protein